MSALSCNDAIEQKRTKRAKAFYRGHVALFEVCSSSLKGEILSKERQDAFAPAARSLSSLPSVQLHAFDLACWRF
jgi:hypothetical protein